VNELNEGSVRHLLYLIAKDDQLLSYEMTLPGFRVESQNKER